MAIQTKFVVAYRGEAVEFSNEADAVRFDLQAQRAEKIVGLLLDQEDLELPGENKVHEIAMALAARSDEMAKIFTPTAPKGAKKGAKGPRGHRTARTEKPAGGAPARETALPTEEQQPSPAAEPGANSTPEAVTA
jgi:dsDNA-binding SOS-regulon protein